MSYPRRTRLYTSWGTVCYIDPASRELRHGHINNSPDNIVLEAMQTDPRTPWQGRLVELKPQGCQSRTVGVPEGQDAPNSDIHIRDAPVGHLVFNIVRLKSGVVALECDGRFLSAEPDGSLAIAVQWCRLWEFFIVSEYWSEPLPNITLRDSSVYGEFDIAQDELETFIADPGLRTKAIIEANFLNASMAPIENTEPASGQLLDLDQSGSRPIRIFKTIHVVWVGDETLRPDSCIETWREMNPDWTVRIWGNHELGSGTWRNLAHLREMAARELCGVADIMRWEILDRFGGFAVDADSICVRPIEEWLFEPEIFACWENELARPGLIANGYVYAHPGNTLIRQVIKDIQDLPDLNGGRAWQLVGPKRLTDTYRNMAYNGMTIYPSHYFMPQHLTGLSYSGRGPVFAEQLWGSTKEGSYDRLKANHL